MSDETMDHPSDEPLDQHAVQPTAPTPEVSDAGIPLPPAGGPGHDTAPHPLGSPAPTPPPPYGAPLTPPPESPGSSYALGALAGNPHLGPGFSGPPTNPGWPTAAGPASGGPTNGAHRVRNSALVAAAAVVALAAGVGIGHAAWTTNTPTVSASGGNATNPSNGSGNSGVPGYSGSPFVPNQNGSGSSGPADVSSIAAKVDPGLVDINTTLGYQQEQAAGTGIVLTSNGEVLTNNHVIDGATTISVTDVGNGKTYSASVVGYDRSHDIAVLQLHNASGLQTATIGNSSTAAVGEDVVGIGNAGGTGGTPSAAGGTVTAINKSITANDEDGSSEQLNGLIETNADIQAGDSGGSLVNTSGQVIGIDTAASAGFSFQSPDQSSGNEGFAIPINQAISIARQIESGTSTSTVHIGATAFLGVTIEPVGSNNGSNGFGGFGGFGNSNGNGTSTSGALVAGVVTSSPAQEAGLAQGDVITSVNGTTINTPTDLTTAFEPDHPGDKVTIGWTDTSGGTHTAKVQLSSGPPQ
jgi:S1-C subfamily serine protease